MKTHILNSIVDKSGINRADIAAQMGISRMQLYRLLATPSRMRIEQMVQLASILNKSPRYLISVIKAL